MVVFLHMIWTHFYHLHCLVPRRFIIFWLCNRDAKGLLGKCTLPISHFVLLLSLQLVKCAWVPDKHPQICKKYLRQLTQCKHRVSSLKHLLQILQNIKFIEAFLSRLRNFYSVNQPLWELTTVVWRQSYIYTVFVSFVFSANESL